jgi:hypothetical protein
MSCLVQDYLRTLTGLSREGRLKLMLGILGQLRDHGDELRSEPARRLSPSSPYFRFDYIFLDHGCFCRVDVSLATPALVTACFKWFFLIANRELDW